MQQWGHVIKTGGRRSEAVAQALVCDVVVTRGWGQMVEAPNVRLSRLGTQRALQED